MHGKGVDFKDVWLAMSRPHSTGCLFIEGEMNLLASLRLESLKDCFHKSRRRPVKQHGRMLLGRQPKLDRH